MNKLLEDFRYLFREDYIYDFNYIVNIGLDMFGFSKISNITINCDVDTFREGGGGLGIKYKEGKALETLTLEKGVTRMKADAFERHYRTGYYIKNLLIIVLDRYKIPEMGFYFEEGIITQRKYSNLDARSGNILMMTMEIKHTGLEEILI